MNKFLSKTKPWPNLFLFFLLWGIFFWFKKEKENHAHALIKRTIHSQPPFLIPKSPSLIPSPSSVPSS